MADTTTKQETLKRDDVLRLLRNRREELSQLGVASLAIFGSVARDENVTVESDLDVLVRFEDRPTFRGYMGLKFFLEDLLGCPVDLVTEGALRPELRPTVERDAVYVT